MLQDIAAAIFPGFILSFMIGPVFFVLLETSVVKGFKAAIIFDLGVVLADVIFIFIAYFSSYRLIQTIKDDPALFIFGGLVMFTYGMISLIKNKKEARNIADEDTKAFAENNYYSLFIKGFFLNFINVGVLGYWLLILITIGPRLKLDPSRMFTFLTTMVVTYFITDIFKIIAAKQLRNKLNAKNTLLIKKFISIVLIISGFFILSQGLLPKDKQIVTKAAENIENNR
jgi:threonine/homoserine/homoserine lactone efflux protein